MIRRSKTRKVVGTQLGVLGWRLSQAQDYSETKFKEYLLDFVEEMDKNKLWHRCTPKLVQSLWAEVRAIIVTKIDSPEKLKEQLLLLVPELIGEKEIKSEERYEKRVKENIESLIRIKFGSTYSVNESREITEGMLDPETNKGYIRVHKRIIRDIEQNASDYT